MARVRSQEQGKQDVRVHRTEVDCAYQVVRTTDGSAYLHLSTFGSDERAASPRAARQFSWTRIWRVNSWMSSGRSSRPSGRERCWAGPLPVTQSI